jgi:hypothetical protein
MCISSFIMRSLLVFRSILFGALFRKALASASIFIMDIFLFIILFFGSAIIMFLLCCLLAIALCRRIFVCFLTILYSISRLMCPTTMLMLFLSLLCNQLLSHGFPIISHLSFFLRVLIIFIFLPIFNFLRSMMLIFN